MTFYLRPPRGETNLHTLLETVQQRIDCFKRPQEDFDIRKIDNFEYLLEDSTLDRCGHYIFRLGVLAGTITKSLFLEKEVLLLKKRIDFYNRKDVEIFLKKIIKQLRSCICINIDKELSEFYWTLYKIVSEMLENDYLNHIFKKHFSQSESLSLCTGEWCISVPFYYCGKIFSQRNIDLKNGNVLFPCRMWKDVLMVLYASYLKIVLNQMRYSDSVTNTLMDNRIKSCLELLKSFNHLSDSDNGNSDGKMELKNLIKEVEYFPLCMKNLFNSLLENHRLTHNERFDLSIFLKEAGLSLNDSIKFWQEEYSKQHSSCSKCSHNWQGNEKKYIYGIRHLYGIEGSRKHYSVRSCDYLQGNSIGINSRGGCPFVHHDDDNLRSALKKSLQGFEDEIEVMIFERINNPLYACNIYRDCCLKNSKQNVLTEKTEFRNPLHYYNQIKNK